MITGHRAHDEGVKRGEAEAGYADQGGADAGYADQGYAEPPPAPTDDAPPPRPDRRRNSGSRSAATNLGDQRDCCELQSLRVAPELRGAGLGVRLLTAAEHEARVRGCRQTVIFVHDFQPLALYERFGFEELARVTDFPTGSAAIWMRKPIDGSAPRDL